MLKVVGKRKQFHLSLGQHSASVAIYSSAKYSILGLPSLVVHVVGKFLPVKAYLPV